MLGVDIDPRLISSALRYLQAATEEESFEISVSDYKSYSASTWKVKIPKNHAIELFESSDIKVESLKGYFPISCSTSNGPLPLADLIEQVQRHKQESGNFPFNLSFRSENFVAELNRIHHGQKARGAEEKEKGGDAGGRVADGSEPDEEQQDEPKKLETLLKKLGDPEERFDTILCLSVTKWIHLNWGDIGLKFLFHKVFRSLRDEGGTFVLEPQPWKSYKKKHWLTERIRKNYSTIQFVPDMFEDYLLKTVGFKACKKIEIPDNQEISKGFKRPIFIFSK